MISEQLNRVEQKLEKYLKNENLEKDTSLTLFFDENIYTSLVLSFNGSDEKLVFFDTNDGYIDIIRFEGNISEVDNVIKANDSSINTLEYHEIVDIEEFVKFDIEDVINRIDIEDIGR